MNLPARLGKYTVIGLIGEGAMGVVYRAVDPDIGRTVAIKTLRASARTPGAAERFLNEARAVGRLSHPGIVAIHEYGQDGDHAFIVMEHIEGRTLAQILDAIPVPGEQATLRVMDQLLGALDCAHRAGVLHRDIKPGNLIDTPQRQIKVTDFGIARIAGNGAPTATQVGTPGYMAPEQYSGAPVGPVTDVFGAGVLLYRMLCGRAPFRGTPENILYKLLNETPPPPSRLLTPPGRDARYDAIALKAIARDPDRRYSSAAAFRSALRQAADGDAVIVPTRAPTTGPAAQPTWTPASGGLSDDELARAELALTEAIGPVARTLVRNAARHSADLAELARQLAGSLDSAARTAFLARLSGMPRSGADSRRTATGTGSTGTAAATPADEDAITPERLDRLRLAITAQMGPVAAIVIRRAQANAHGWSDLLRRVVDEVATGADRDALMASLRRL
ncbi:serine/threonine-protein kinase [Derxia lacustris]|uniref:serine/threonine-protein kinase n=1 Tax=Derxia lacustris TaxID=764842 RepID=UPI000A16D4D9|nr:serine/threonine-protein kinase [Derxia lacustris]